MNYLFALSLIVITDYLISFAKGNISEDQTHFKKRGVFRKAL